MEIKNQKQKENEINQANENIMKSKMTENKKEELGLDLEEEAKLPE